MSSGGKRRARRSWSCLGSRNVQLLAEAWHARTQLDGDRGCNREGGSVSGLSDAFGAWETRAALTEGSTAQVLHLAASGGTSVRPLCTRFGIGVRSVPIRTCRRAEP